jgi:8-oxo-dGTP diphosphatase
MNRPGVGVAVFIIRDHKFLMIKRRGSHGNGTWSVPGGWMEYGEAFEETSTREVLEEVGLKIKNVNFGAVTNNIFRDEKVHTITIWLTSDYVSGEPKILEPEKISKIEWKDLESLPSPLFEPAWKELLKSEFIANIKKQLQ